VLVHCPGSLKFSVFSRPWSCSLFSLQHVEFVSHICEYIITLMGEKMRPIFSYRLYLSLLLGRESNHITQKGEKCPAMT
jgi:hypothetical protein